MSEHWELEQWRKPKLPEGATEMFSECGRILENIDYRSHWFVLCKQQFGGYALLVQHGGGEETIPLGYSRRYQHMFSSLDSDTRYLMFNALMQAYHDGDKAGREKTAKAYRNAFVEGRLKKRKMPNQDQVKVWIE